MSTEPVTQGSRRLNLKDVKEAPTVSEESVGMELRAMRMQRGESIPQVSQVLRIRKDMVEAIEHGRHDLLPGQAYEIGFVRSYADYLGLDTADVVRRYKAELASQEEGKHFTIQVPEDEQRFSFVSISIILVCLIAAAGGAWYLAKQAGWLDGNRPLAPSSSITEPEGTTPQPAITEPSAAATAGPAPAVAPAPAPVVTPPPPPPAPARPGGIVAPAPGEGAQPITGRELGKSNTTSRITYVARRETFLSVTGPRSRQPYINRMLNVGDAYRVPNLPDLKVSIADGGAMDVILDKEFIGRAGPDGAPINDFAVSPVAYGGPVTAPETPAVVPAPAEVAPAAPVVVPPAGTVPPASAPVTPPATPPAGAPVE